MQSHQLSVTDMRARTLLNVHAKKSKQLSWLVPGLSRTQGATDVPDSKVPQGTACPEVLGSLSHKVAMQARSGLQAISSFSDFSS